MFSAAAPSARARHPALTRCRGRWSVRQRLNDQATSSHPTVAWEEMNLPKRDTNPTSGEATWIDLWPQRLRWPYLSFDPNICCPIHLPSCAFLGFSSLGRISDFVCKTRVAIFFVFVVSSDYSVKFAPNLRLRQGGWRGQVKGQWNCVKEMVTGNPGWKGGKDGVVETWK